VETRAVDGTISYHECTRLPSLPEAPSWRLYSSFAYKGLSCTSTWWVLLKSFLWASLVSIVPTLFPSFLLICYPYILSNFDVSNVVMHPVFYSEHTHMPQQAVHKKLSFSSSGQSTHICLNKLRIRNLASVPVEPLCGPFSPFHMHIYHPSRRLGLLKKLSKKTWFLCLKSAMSSLHLLLGPRLCDHYTCSWAHLHLAILLTTILNLKRTEVVTLGGFEGHKLFV